MHRLALRCLLALALTLALVAATCSTFSCNPNDFKGYSYDASDPEVCGLTPVTHDCDACLVSHCCAQALTCFGGPHKSEGGVRPLPTRSQCSDLEACSERSCAGLCPGGSTGGAGGPPAPALCKGTCGAADCGSCPTVAMVSAGAFQIDSIEVSNRQFRAWLITSPSTSGQPESCSWNTGFPTPQGDDDLPVGGVNWCDAYAYCVWAGKRLCGGVGGGSADFSAFAERASSQWHAACVGPNDRVYPYGDTYQPKACNGADYGAGETTYSLPSDTCVGGYPSLFNMSGNVGEWEDSCDGATGPKDLCHVRGGSWHDGEPNTKDEHHDLSCAASVVVARQERYADIGFRCCSAP